jgi:phosphoserine phosphatase
MTFDMDGTLISEEPSYYMVQFVSNYIDVSGIKSKSDLIATLKDFSSRPDYIDLCKDYVKNNPPKIYSPMLELVEYSIEQNYKVIICTGSEAHLAKEIAAIYFPMFHDVIGTDFSVRVNDKEGKVVNLKENNIKPMFAFGNSSGDFAMMKYASQKSYLVIKNDEKSKEYDTPDEHIEACKQNNFGYYRLMEIGIMCFSKKIN